MLAEQCRAARAMLDIAREDLARMATVAERTIADFEAGRRQPIPSTLAALRRALERAGIEFTDGYAPGVRLRRRGPPDEGLRPEELTSENDG